MNRRQLLAHLALALPVSLLAPTLRGHAAEPSPAADAASAEAGFPPVDITPEQWRELLEPARFRVLFRDATEPPGSSPLDKQYAAGTYVCAACFLPLFSSEDKFDSGTGWPSFTRAIEGRVGTQRDFKLILPRTEYHCVRCDGHQGHVFNDGPAPTGKRWCNNGLALRFVPEGEPLPALRTSA